MIKIFDIFFLYRKSFNKINFQKIYDMKKIYAF